MRVVDGKHVRAAVRGAAAAGIGGVIEAVESSVRRVIVRVLGTQQFLLVEPVVDLQIPLIANGLHGSRIHAVDRRAVVCVADVVVGFRKVLHQF